MEYNFEYLEEAYQQAKKDVKSFEKIPEGRYYTIISECGVGEYQDGEKRIELGFTISEGAYKGRSIKMFCGVPEQVNLNSEKAKWQTQAIAKAFGALAPKWRLMECIKGRGCFVGKRVSVQIKNKLNSDYQNIYINAVLDTVADTLEEEQKAVQNKKAVSAPKVGDGQYDPFADE